MLERISFKEALELVLDHIPLMPSEEVGIVDLGGRVLAEDAVALVDSPSIDASLKDGYAVYSPDIAAADINNPIPLKLTGFHAAGEMNTCSLSPGCAIRLTTGAQLPPGAQAVLASEFASEEGSTVWCTRDAGLGRNVLSRGTDVKKGEVVARRGEMIRPALVGLIAASGLNSVRVYKLPRVLVIGTGDEVLAPGEPLQPGKLYASNMAETVAWLKHMGIGRVMAEITPDRQETIRNVLLDYQSRADVFITSGGAWGSERDLVVKLLDSMGWTGIFHRVRLGPGKAAGFGLLNGKPVFILPGGPPSYEAALLLLALPGITAMRGQREPCFPRVNAKLADDVKGRSDWSQVIQMQMYYENGDLMAHHLKSASRLSSMADKNGILILDEGRSEFKAGEKVEIIQVAGIPFG